MGSVDTETEIKCPKCKKMINRDRAAKNKYVCYECGYYFRVKTHNRIRMVADRKSFQPWFEEIEESNPLKYEGYEEKLSEAREKSGVKEAVTVGECEIYGEKAVIGICESKFMMGSIQRLYYKINWSDLKKFHSIFSFCRYICYLCYIVLFYFSDISACLDAIHFRKFYIQKQKMISVFF